MKKEPPSNNSKPIRWHFAIPIVLVIALAVDYYVLHILFPIKQKALIERSLNEMTAAEKSVFQPAEQKQAPPERSDITPDIAQSLFEASFRKALGNCAPEIAAQGIGSPKGLLEYLKTAVGIEIDQVQIENYNFILKDGSERRIHLIPADESNSSSSKEMRYYKLDAEGLPERIFLPKEEALNPSPAVIEKLMKDSTLKLHQIKSSIKYKDQTQVAVDFVNDGVQSLQFFGPQKTLNCDTQECVCQ